MILLLTWIFGVDGSLHSYLGTSGLGIENALSGWYTHTLTKKPLS